VRKKVEQSRSRFPGEAILSLALLMFVLAGLAAAHQPSEHQGHGQHDAMSRPTEADSMTPAMQAKLLADKKESEFNHHLAGLFVMLAGVFIFCQPRLAKTWPPVKYAWPACFLLSGIFLLVWSDTELWPFGHRAWLEALNHNPEVLQHKTYAVVLIALGAIEWQRARGILKAAWSGWVFPAVAIGGSVLLLFHQHEAGMLGPHHMELMARIQSEHLSYSLVGIGVGLTKGLSDVETPWQGLFRRIWPLLMVVLGILLMFYRE
jgi:putative copper resistance protein D